MAADPVLITQWVTVAVTFIFVALRVYVRMGFRGHLWSLSDFLVVMAWIFYLGLAAMNTVLFKNHWYDQEMWPTLPPEMLILDFKLWYASLGYYYIPLYCVKAAMLCFYIEFVPKVLTKTRIAMFATAGLVGVGILYTLLINFFWCAPNIASNWSLDFEGCHSGYPLEVTFSVSAFHILTDALVWSLPFLVLRLMSNLSFGQKVGAALMFALGFVCTAAAILSWVINSITINGKRLSEDYRLTFMFFTVEQTTAIVVACCPALRAFLQRAAGPTLKRIASVPKLSSSTSREKIGHSAVSSGLGDNVSHITGAAADAASSRENMIRMETQNTIGGNRYDVDLERSNRARAPAAW